MRKFPEPGIEPSPSSDKAKSITLWSPGNSFLCISYLNFLIKVRLLREIVLVSLGRKNPWIQERPDGSSKVTSLLSKGSRAATLHLILQVLHSVYQSVPRIIGLLGKEVKIQKTELRFWGNAVMLRRNCPLRRKKGGVAFQNVSMTTHDMAKGVFQIIHQTTTTTTTKIYFFLKTWVASFQYSFTSMLTLKTYPQATKRADAAALSTL